MTTSHVALTSDWPNSCTTLLSKSISHGTPNSIPGLALARPNPPVLVQYTLANHPSITYQPTHPVLIPDYSHRHNTPVASRHVDHQ
ncbi:hypothetical protein L873DRAFT_1800957 [Choiromyces venosus 120613-1]|uniref:Uncharacterized protein n=1 Tax=Choiromyces venosus 120613-1 TaxID=1336337 RepID=A0A3N4K1E8_9PEZI|nr:hypothetical protein L873DRAFT_1800957 [Choiromyces venosus 120613-1]